MSRGEELERTARSWGVEPGYRDYKGQWQSAPASTLEAILDALGAGCARPSSSAIVKRVDRPVDLSGWSEVRLENGDGIHAPGSAVEIPPGYHTVVAADGTERRLIASPGACWLPEGLKTWGWALQLYALRSARSWGMGDLWDLRQFGRRARADGAGCLLINPLHACLPGPHQQASPYFPSSRCWRNPLYIAIDEVPGAASSEIDELASRGRALNSGALIDRDEVNAVKIGALERIWSHSRPEIDRDDPALLDYATFVSLAECFGGGRSSFPRGYANPADAAVERWRVRNRDRISFHVWLQQLLDFQFEAAATEIGIINDLAIGMDPDGADAWVWQDAIAPGMRIGAPPDEFNLAGQNWGLPPFDPWKLRSTGYDAFIQTVRAGMRHAAGVRVDHVMGLFRLFWIPDGASATEGAYVRYPFEELLDILALESHRAQAFVVGEDLGTVEPVVRSEMHSRRMLSYKLLWFENGDPSDYPELALAAVTNHDLPTIAGLWSGSDLHVQSDIGLRPNPESTEAMLAKIRARLGIDQSAGEHDVIEGSYRLLARAPSAIVTATLEDALAVRERPNFPGTVSEHPNWRRALPATLEDIHRRPLVQSLARILGRRD